MESQLPVNNSPQPEETVGAVLLKTLRELLPIFLAEIILTGVMLGIYALCASAKSRSCSARRWAAAFRC